MRFTVHVSAQKQAGHPWSYHTACPLYLRCCPHGVMHWALHAVLLVIIHCVLCIARGITGDLVTVQSEKLASELVQKLPAAALAALIGTLSVSSADVARAAEYYTPPGSSGGAAEAVRQQAPQSVEFPAGSTAVAPAVKSGEFQLPEGNQWRYSEFINAVQAGKVERVRFSKEGGQLQARASHLAISPPWQQGHEIAQAKGVHELQCGRSCLLAAGQLQRPLCAISCAASASACIRAGIIGASVPRWQGTLPTCVHLS